MAKLFDDVRPGDLITASFINQLLKTLGTFDDRIAALESVGTGEGAALGFIDLVYKNSPRGTQLVPGDPSPYPHVLTVSNRTDKTLTIALSGSVTAAHGTWSRSVQFKSVSGVMITSVTLASQVSQDVTAAVTVPGDAQIGDVATLSVTISVPAPHNKQNHANLTMNVAGASGPPVVRSVAFHNPVIPGGDLNNIQPASPLAYIFNVRYTTSQPPTVGNFTLRVTLLATPSDTVGDWSVFFGGLARVNPSPGVFEARGIQLDASASSDTQLTVQIRPPAARGPQDKNLSFTVRLESTDLAEATGDDTGPFTLRLPHI